MTVVVPTSLREVLLPVERTSTLLLPSSMLMRTVSSSGAVVYSKTATNVLAVPVGAIEYVPLVITQSPPEADPLPDASVKSALKDPLRDVGSPPLIREDQYCVFVAIAIYSPNPFIICFLIFTLTLTMNSSKSPL